MTLFGEGKKPIIIWVGPQGASATSAGAILASGAHFLYMADGTNMGAATPIQMSGDIEKKDARNKAINDIVSLVRSLSQARGRNSKGFEEMVAKAKSFTALEAEKEGLIDSLANSPEDIKNHLHQKKIKIQGQSFTLNTSLASFVSFEMDFGQKLLNIFANPSMAYILFLIGAALIYLEFQAPGGLIAGSLGALCLVLAGIGLQVLPLNFGAFSLLILSFALFIVEVYVTSYGLLSLAGLASLIFGSLFLFRTDDSYLELSSSIIYAAASAIACFVGILALIMIKSKRKYADYDFNSLVGKDAHIIAMILEEEGTYFYQVKINGEIWKAQAKKLFDKGAHVKISAQHINDMVLEID